MRRCEWAKNELYIAYHDHEWGVPVHDDHDLFEFLILEGMQAGLSWETILRKRDNYRAALDNFEVSAVASYKQAKVRQLLANPGIIRNRLKIEAAVQNARSFLVVQEEFGSFDAYVWEFVGGRQIQNKWRSWKEVPTSTSGAHAMRKDLRRRGFKVAGPSISDALLRDVQLDY